MKSYQDIVERVLKNGKDKDTRAGKTLAVPSVYWEHNPEDGFPLITSRRMPIKSIAVELEGFIKGITSKKWYQERGCRFWDNWANGREVELAYSSGGIFGRDGKWHPKDGKSRTDLAKELDDLGPLGYSYQMRHFGLCYDEDDNGPLEGIDQLADVVRKLKENPNDRRMIVSYWNPPQLDRMALPPCTVCWGVTVIDGQLNLSWFQRSVDFQRGGSCDIASMALLQKLLCHFYGFKTGVLSALFLDCHIYIQDIEPSKILLSRTPYDLPQIEITGGTDIFDWTHQNFELINYKYHESIQLGPLAV